MKHRWLGMVGTVLPTLLVAQIAHKPNGGRSPASRSCVPTTDTRSTSKPGTSGTSSGTGRPGIRGSGMAGTSRSVNDSGGSSTRRSGTRPPASTAPCPRQRTSGTTLPTSRHTPQFLGNAVYEHLPGALARHGRADTDRPARAHDRGPRTRGGKSLRGGPRRGPINTSGRDTLVSDGGGWNRSPLCPTASAAQPVGDSRWTERTGAP